MAFSVDVPSLTLSATTNLPPLEDLLPSIKTGVGIVTSMQTNPTSTNWDGVQITEALSITSNTCSFGTFCTDTSTFTVGEGGEVFGVQFPATQNIFYDRHTTTATFSALHQAGQESCQVVCQQTYSCGGQVIGTFTVTRTFQKDTIQGTPVTRVTITKQ
jgi:hypothetical protein